MKTKDLMQRQKNAKTELLWLIPYSKESEECVDRSNQPTQQGIFLLWSTQNSHPRKGESQRMVQIQHVGWQKTQLFQRHKTPFTITQKIFKTCSKNNLTSTLSFCTNTWSQVWCWIMYIITTGSAIASELPKFVQPLRQQGQTLLVSTWATKIGLVVVVTSQEPTHIITSLQHHS